MNNSNGNHFGNHSSRKPTDDDNDNDNDDQNGAPPLTLDELDDQRENDEEKEAKMNAEAEVLAEFHHLTIAPRSERLDGRPPSRSEIDEQLRVEQAHYRCRMRIIDRYKQFRELRQQKQQQQRPMGLPADVKNQLLLLSNSRPSTDHDRNNDTNAHQETRKSEGDDNTRQRDGGEVGDRNMNRYRLSRYSRVAILDLRAPSGDVVVLNGGAEHRPVSRRSLSNGSRAHSAAINGHANQAPSADAVQQSFGGVQPSGQQELGQNDGERNALQLPSIIVSPVSDDSSNGSGSGSGPQSSPESSSTTTPSDGPPQSHGRYTMPRKSTVLRMSRAATVETESTTAQRLNAETPPPAAPPSSFTSITPTVNEARQPLTQSTDNIVSGRSLLSDSFERHLISFGIADEMAPTAPLLETINNGADYINDDDDIEDDDTVTDSDGDSDNNDGTPAH